MKLLSDNATYRIDADPDDETKLTATFRIQSCPGCPHGPLAELPHIWKRERPDLYEFTGRRHPIIHYVTDQRRPEIYVCWG